jgi:2-dehydro-3-deoxyphosphooctonate aldolase (KDO 8-P synthase)
MEGGVMILICGPCVIENFESLEYDANKIKNIVDKYPDIDFYFKSSCVKDNRTSLQNYYGPGFDEGIKQLLRIKNKGIKITTDFHTPSQIKQYAYLVDLIQIPAFLSMQTSIITEAVKIGKPIHIKKPQWLPPYDVKKPISKVFEQFRNTELFITDRGTSFGYGDVMFDPRHIKMMKGNGAKVLVDITHPQNHSEIYDRSYAEPLGMAAIATGVDGLFMEATYLPENARCDSDSMIPIDSLEEYIDKFIKLYRFINA